MNRRKFLVGAGAAAAGGASGLGSGAFTTGRPTEPSTSRRQGTRTRSSG
ncbi:MAG: twin-arginine translocation signal domain-containing protein [Halobacteriales archaeon]|nr:twin-arginine translocation signal domain-containing protein [Halobacteriales archaeon]